ncbi:hypothetical protein U9M48_015989 [Paspalum notatum var. saurae]|uniref:Uncharacterized protein n=1 Tax=Paspalum notatum var. saurae TaxID=547442 RepID=A0AAQ3WMB2_PASNO
MSDGTATCIDIILAIILPPLGVFFKFGCGVSSQPSSGSASSSPSSATSPASSTPSGPSPSRRRTTTPLFKVGSPLAAYLDLLWSFHRSPLLSTLPPGLSPSSSDPYAVNRPGSACVAGRQEVKAEEEEEDVGRRHGDLHRHHPRHHPAAAWGLLQVRLRGQSVEFWICLILTFFGYLPGIIYAVWAITK